MGGKAPALTALPSRPGAEIYKSPPHGAEEITGGRIIQREEQKQRTWPGDGVERTGEKGPPPCSAGAEKARTEGLRENLEGSLSTAAPCYPPVPIVLGEIPQKKSYECF